MLDDFLNIFSTWIEQIERALKENDGAQKIEDKDPGPKSELEIWRQNMRKLTCISEKLRSKECRTVYEVMTQASQNTAELGKPRDKMYMLTSRWRSIELKVTEQLNEAKDNVKYLTTLEKFIEPLYDGTPETIKDTLPALMNSIKMIHTIARYYNTSPRMTGLFIKITNQMIANCKHNILNFKKGKSQQPTGGRRGQQQGDGILWDHEACPPGELIEVLN